MSAATRQPGRPAFRVRSVEGGEDLEDGAPSPALSSEPAQAASGAEVSRSAGEVPSAGEVAAGGERRRTSRPTERPAAAGRRRLLVPVLAVLAVLGIAGSIVFGLAWRSASAVNSAQQSVASSARALVVALTNFDPGTIRADFQRIQSMSTGTFASQAQHFFGTSIGHELSAAGAASRGKVASLDVQWVSGSRASVFAVVSQSYLNDHQKTPIVDTLRLVIGLTSTGGHWLVSNVQVLQQPTGSVGG